MHAIKLRIAHNFVSLFSRTKAVHKDIVLSYLYDGLAQTLYYAMQVAYPGSRVELDTSIFKHDLIKLFARWTLGHIPANITCSHWKILLREQKESVVMEQAPIATNAIHSVAQLEDKLKQARQARTRRVTHAGRTSRNSGPPDYNTKDNTITTNPTISSGGSGGVGANPMSATSPSLGVALLGGRRHKMRRGSLPMSPSRAFGMPHYPRYIS
jgi:hypothetical protein